MIHRALADVGELSGPMALVLSEAEVAALPPLTTVQLADAAHGGAPSVVRRQLIAALAARVLGVAAGSVRLVAAADGRRMIAGRAVFASVAWRPGWVAAALSSGPVGVDVELVAEAEAARDVALDGFDGDATRLAAWHGPAGVWAAKEATLKAIGQDLGYPARWDFGDMTVAVDAHRPLHIVLRPIAGAVVALACRGAER